MPARAPESVSFDLSQSCLSDEDLFDIPEAVEFNVPLTEILFQMFNDKELARTAHHERIDYILNYQGTDSFDAAEFVDEFMGKCRRCFQPDELKASMLDFVRYHYSVADKKFIARIIKQ